MLRQDLVECLWEPKTENPGTQQRWQPSATSDSTLAEASLALRSLLLLCIVLKFWNVGAPGTAILRQANDCMLHCLGWSTCGGERHFAKPAGYNAQKAESDMVYTFEPAAKNRQRHFLSPVAAVREGPSLSFNGNPARCDHGSCVCPKGLENKVILTTARGPGNVMTGRRRCSAACWSWFFVYLSHVDTC